MMPGNISRSTSPVLSDDDTNTGFRIVEGDSLILVRVGEGIDLKSANSITDQVLDHPSYHRDFRGIVDLRHGNLRFSVEDMDDYVLKLLGHHNVTVARWAIVVHDPVDTALAFILQKKMKQQNEVEVFFLLENAAKWLSLSWPNDAVLDFLAEDDV